LSLSDEQSNYVGGCSARGKSRNEKKHIDAGGGAEGGVDDVFKAVGRPRAKAQESINGGIEKGGSV